MLSFVRPPPRPDFAPEAELLLGQVREAVVKRGGAPHGDDFKSRAVWSGSYKRGVHKRQLCANLDLVKCAYCEEVRPPGRELDVEHYRPKVEVTRWDGDPPLVSSDPPQERPEGSGYWWLAFSWDNYALACKTCNAGWKRNLFPVQMRHPCTEGVEAIELPLLLDPGSPFRTADHFRWDSTGHIWPCSPQGHATIVTCGLNRRALVSSRHKTMRDVTSAVADVIDCARRGRLDLPQLAALGQRGARNERFAGMVRCIVEDRLGRPWERIDGFPE